MADNLMNFVILSYAIFFLILFLIFVYQTAQKGRSAPYFIITLFFGFLGGLFSYFEALFSSTNFDIWWFFSNLFFGLQFVSFFLFTEKLRTLKISALMLSIAIIFFTIQIVTSLAVMNLSNLETYGNIIPVLSFLANISNELLALYVYFIIGVAIYIKIYRYAKEIRPLIMILALIIVGIGFIIMISYDLLNFFGTIPGWLMALKNAGIDKILPLIGLFLFLLCYITNIDYLYRLPNDNYVLMVSYKSGITIHTIHFKTRYRHVEIDENLLSGLITSINMVYQSVLSSKAEVQNILSKDASILMQSGKYIYVTIVSNNVSAILDRSLKRYVREFEKKFQKQLEKERFLISDFDSAKDLLKSIFPYLLIKN